MSRPNETKHEKAPNVRRRRSVRWAVRLICLAAAIVLLYPLVPWPKAALVVPALSPLVAASSALATWTLPPLVGIGLLVGVVTLIRRRWFCRWVCPVGVCADTAGGLGRRLGRRCPRLPAIGQWIALLTLAGACLGYPILLWLDPMALFAGTFGLGGRAMPWWAALGLPAVLLPSLLLPGVWCTRLCPLGALQEMLWRVVSVFRRRGRQTGHANTGQLRLARRTLIFGAVGAAWATAVKATRAGSTPRLRPPGAIAPDLFSGVCMRCGNCTRVCPPGIIHPVLGGDGVAGFLAPGLAFDEDFCRKDCTRCMDVCPSGALVPAAGGDKMLVPIGFPRVDMDVCLLGDDRDCFSCRNSCPYEAIHLEFSEETYTLTPRIDAERCPGCGACEAACPTRPVRAIVVVPTLARKAGEGGF